MDWDKIKLLLDVYEGARGFTELKSIQDAALDELRQIACPPSEETEEDEVTTAENNPCPTVEDDEVEEEEEDEDETEASS